MELIIRNETESDYRKVEELTREAFWNIHVPGCDEHYLVHTLRNSKQFIPELDFVAVADGMIVGNIMYAHSSIMTYDNEKYQVITFGPISVLPSHQNLGIGSKLIEVTKKKAFEMGFTAILIYGDPEYYSRFGFVAAEEYNIKSSSGMYAAALQAYELYPNALKGVSGRFYEGESYEINQNLAEEFDKTFPAKEKLVTPYQTRFKELVRMIHE